MGPPPKNIVMLTGDAFGVLPPIARLTPGQAMYHFLSGYTAKVAGTEIGVTEPKRPSRPASARPSCRATRRSTATCSRSGSPAFGVDCWLVNTGWTGGKYGEGKRMPIKATRALLAAALDGSLKNARVPQGSELRLRRAGACRASRTPSSTRAAPGRQGRIRPHGSEARRPVRREFRAIRGSRRRGGPQRVSEARAAASRGPAARKPRLSGPVADRALSKDPIR
jgi:hypothetical protein